MLIWIQLPGLPIEYYDSLILFEIAKLLGKPIKLDVHTGNMNRARYARICIEMDSTQPLPSKIRIDSIVQAVHYELKSLFCYSCGCLGHIAPQCNKCLDNKQKNVNLENNNKEEWTIISHRPKQNNNIIKQQQVHNRPNNKNAHPGPNLNQTIFPNKNKE